MTPGTPYRTDTVSVGHDGPVTIVTITRPERRNAVDSLCAEALQIGLVNRVVAPGAAGGASVDLARQLAALPQFCLRSDRMSVLEQWGMTEGGPASSSSDPMNRS